MHKLLKSILPLTTLIFLCAFMPHKEWHWKKLPKVTESHLRGLSVVDDDVVWASGANGTFLVTHDGGDSWETGTIDSEKRLDFRDIHGFDGNKAIAMSSGENYARMYLTDDGGKNWELMYQNEDKGIFFDGVDFADENRGVAFSDPVDGTFYIVQTKDGGRSWNRISTKKLPKTLEGEAGFAASGTGVVYKNKNIWIATGGGEKARVFHSADDGDTWNAYDTPMASGEGTGIFSLSMLDELNGVVVGGSYMDSTNTVANCALTNDGGKTWELLFVNQPNGYRSCVAAHEEMGILFAVGRTGIDSSMDGGRTWKAYSDEGYYACGISERYIYAVGRSGKMGKMELF
mgnify:CR=1 FL=1